MFIITKGKLIIHPDNLLMDKLAIDNLELKMKSEAVKSKAAGVSAAWVEHPWRWEMISKEQGVNELWLLHPQNRGLINVSASTTRFPPTVLRRKRSLATRAKQLINSFGQDSVYAVTCDRSHSKHILPLCTVKSLADKNATCLNIK